MQYLSFLENYYVLYVTEITEIAASKPREDEKKIKTKDLSR